MTRRPETPIYRQIDAAEAMIESLVKPPPSVGDHRPATLRKIIKRCARLGKPLPTVAQMDEYLDCVKSGFSPFEEIVIDDAGNTAGRLADFYVDWWIMLSESDRLGFVAFCRKMSSIDRSGPAQTITEENMPAMLVGIGLRLADELYVDGKRVLIPRARPCLTQDGRDVDDSAPGGYQSRSISYISDHPQASRAAFRNQQRRRAR